MKIKCIDKRKIIVSDTDVCAIVDNGGDKLFKINGNEYYLAKAERFLRDVYYEVTFLSKNQIEIELEVMSDGKVY